MLVYPLLLPAESPPADSEGPVGVVIPAYNNAGTIAQAVQSLQRQNVPTEIIVVDDASTDDTAALAEQTGVRVVRRTVNGGPAAARNEGAKQLQTRFLFFAEADGHYAPDYLLVCLRALSEKRVGASLAAGIKGWTDRNNAVVRLSDALWVARHSLMMLGKRGTGAWCYRREVFEQLGGFNESLRYGEDVDLARRVESLGLRTGVAGWSTLTHRNPDTWRSWWQRAARGTETAAAGQRPSAISMLSYLAKTILLLSAPAGLVLAFAHHPLWIALPLFILLALGLESAESRLAVTYLARRRDWRALSAAPVLLWVRRAAFAVGKWKGWFSATH